MKFAGIIEPGVASGIVTYSKYIQGTYIVVSDYSERDKIPTGVLIEGTPVYISSLKKTQRCHINNKVIEWVDDNASELSVGYYFEDKFYSDAEHTDEIEALQDKLYVDLGKKLDVLGEECVMFEDSLSSLRNAKAFGMKTVGVSKEERIKKILFSHADLVISSFDEITLRG